MSFTIDQIVQRYISLRDERDEISKRHAVELAPFSEKMAAIEAFLLDKLNNDKTDSVKTEHGTAYRSTILSATVGDWDELLNYVLADALERALDPLERNESPDAVLAALRGSPRFQFLNHAVNKTAVAEMLERDKVAPPGVKTAFITRVNVKRP